MESIEERVNSLVDEWQDYCLPDKLEVCKPQVQEFITELDTLLEKNRSLHLI